MGACIDQVAWAFSADPQTAFNPNDPAQCSELSVPILAFARYFEWCVATDVSAMVSRIYR
ncbi:hypothetical protein AMK02_CH02217 [Rhizobium sp. N731]|nr:hypothetical protein AMK02_CH02217 [Rhizobium sp. N731]